MLLRRLAILSLAMAVLASGADKRIVDGKGGNAKLELKAKMYLDRKDIEKVAGYDLNGQYIVVDVTVTPKTSEEVMISYSDFTLLSYKDGQRSQPFTASQVAGKDMLVLSETGDGQVKAGRTSIGIGGLGMGRGTTPTELSAKVKTGPEDEKEDPEVTALKAKEMPEKKTKDPISGLLYFPFDGKIKAKQLELFYKGAAGKFSVTFE